jgi:hypothetical protein
VVAGTPFSVLVNARDANNELAENFADQISLSAAAPTGSNFAVAPVMDAVGGTGSFANLVLDDAATGYVVTASSPTADPDTSNTFTVLPSGVVRTLSLSLKGHLKVSGTLAAPGNAKCRARQKVKIQRLRSGSWVTVETVTTSNTGTYSDRVPDKRGEYRATIAKTVLADGTSCLAATSPTRRHRH